MKRGQGPRHSNDKSMKGQNADCVEQRYNYLKQKSPRRQAVEKGEKEIILTGSVQQYFD